MFSFSSLKAIVQLQKTWNIVHESVGTLLWYFHDAFFLSLPSSHLFLLCGELSYIFTLGSMKDRVIQVWKDMRARKRWQDFQFCLNYSLRSPALWNLWAITFSFGYAALGGFMDDKLRPNPKKQFDREQAL